MQKIENHAHAFNDDGFWHKLTSCARRVGRHAVEKALWLYYTAKAPTTPAWARRAIYAALAYFVLPIDAVPDVVPGIGFTDDISILAAALAGVAMYITPEVKQRAAQTIRRWFGDQHTQGAV